jgi:hypothetical protein
MRFVSSVPSGFTVKTLDKVILPLPAPGKVASAGSVTIINISMAEANAKAIAAATALAPNEDRLFGSLDAERYYGGSGDDTFGDYYPNGDPDYIKCGRGFDLVYYNEGVDTVAPDCEWLRPYHPGG